MNDNHNPDVNNIKLFIMNLKNSFLSLAFVSVVSVAKAGDDAGLSPAGMPDRWSYTPQLLQQSPVDDKWWLTFGDEHLDSLIARSVERNYDISMAIKRIGASRAAIGQARAGYFPRLDLSASWTKEQMSAVTTRFHGSQSIDDYFTLGLDMSWEIDLFGKVRQGVKGKEAQYRATRAQYDGVMVSVAAQVADAYFRLRMYQEQLQLARQHCAEQDKVLKITEARMNAGLASMLDVTQARVILYSTESSIPSIENNIHASANALSVLLSEYPGALEQQLAVPHELEFHQLCDTCSRAGIDNLPSLLPDYRQIVATGIPAELLRRRPDILEAEAEIAGYAAQLGIAKKDFLPTLSINGSIGTSAYKFDDLFTHDSFTYSIAPTLTWTVFDGLSRKYEVTQMKLQVENGIDNYNLTVLNAFTEVDNAMSSYNACLAQIDRLDNVVEESMRSLNLSLDLYTQGLTEFSNVVNAQIDLLQYQNSLISARAAALTSLVALYKAMGGGWME